MNEFFVFLDFLNIYINTNYNFSILIFFFFLLVYNTFSIPGNLIFVGVLISELSLVNNVSSFILYIIVEIITKTPTIIRTPMNMTRYFKPRRLF